MSSIEPGERFTIAFGRGKRQLEVVALSGRQKRRCLQCLASMREARQPDLMLAVLAELEEITRLCAPDITEEVMGTLDDALQAEIVTSTLLKSSVSGEEAKKSESLPL